MKVALVTDNFKIGGGLEHIYQIVTGIQGMQFGIFASGGSALERFKGLKDVLIFDKGYSSGYVLSFRPDLIHIHHLKPLLEFYKNPFCKYKIPVLFTAHGLHIHKFEFLNGIVNKVRYILRSSLERYLLKRVNKVIAVSLGDREFIKTRYRIKEGVYLPNGIDFCKIEEIKTPKVELRIKLNLPLDAFLILTVARFDFQKGYDILIHAIAMIKDKIKDKGWRFVFVGDGEKFEEIRRLTEKLAVSGLIIFTGKRYDVYQIMKTSDIFILPSRWEGLPITLIEAGYCKLPVIASDTYGNREMIKDEIDGLLFKNEDPKDLSDLLLEVIADKYDLNEMKENAYITTKERYGLEKMTNDLGNIYRQFSHE